MVAEHLTWVFEDSQLFLQSKGKEDLLLQLLAIVEHVLTIVLISDEYIAHLLDAFRLMQSLNLLLVCLEQHQYVVLFEVHEPIQIVNADFFEELAEVTD